MSWRADAWAEVGAAAARNAPECDRCAAVQAEAARLRKALDACAQALADHGAHGPACPRLQSLHHCDCGDCDVCRACGCGLDAAIASAEAALAAAKGGTT